MFQLSSLPSKPSQILEAENSFSFLFTDSMGTKTHAGHTGDGLSALCSGASAEKLWHLTVPPGLGGGFCAAPGSRC